MIEYRGVKMEKIIEKPIAENICAVNTIPSVTFQLRVTDFDDER